METFNKTKKGIFIALLAVIVAGGGFFYACKKDNNEVPLASKLEKGNPIVPEDKIFEADKEVCYSIRLKWGLNPKDFIVSYLDADGTTKFYFVSPDTEFGYMLSKIFLRKVETFSGTYEEYCKWSKEQMDNGMIVVGSEDDKGVYHGKAYTNSEWSLYSLGIK